MVSLPASILFLLHLFSKQLPEQNVQKSTLIGYYFTKNPSAGFPSLAGVTLKYFDYVHLLVKYFSACTHNIDLFRYL